MICACSLYLDPDVAMSLVQYTCFVCLFCVSLVNFVCLCGFNLLTIRVLSLLFSSLRIFHDQSFSCQCIFVVNLQSYGARWSDVWFLCLFKLVVVLFSFVFALSCVMLIRRCCLFVCLIFFTSRFQFFCYSLCDIRSSSTYLLRLSTCISYAEWYLSLSVFFPLNDTLVLPNDSLYDYCMSLHANEQ